MIRHFELSLCPVHFQKRWPLLLLSFALFCGSLYAHADVVQLPQHLTMRTDAVTIYEKEYISTDIQEFVFPQKKRNLIHILIESMEKTFADKENKRVKEQNHIPHLTEYIKENIGFSDMLQASGIGYISAGLLAQTSRIPLDMTNYQGEMERTGNIQTLHDILHNADINRCFSADLLRLLGHEACISKIVMLGYGTIILQSVRARSRKTMCQIHGDLRIQSYMSMSRCTFLIWQKMRLRLL